MHAGMVYTLRAVLAVVHLVLSFYGFWLEWRELLSGPLVIAVAAGQDRI